MEMHQLRYVVAVARMGNFSRAAEQCHVSQPSLSQQIQKLEDELMREGTAKFADPFNALLKLLAEKQAAMKAS